MKTRLARSVSVLALAALFVAALGIGSAALACGCGGGGPGGGGGGGGPGGGGGGPGGGGGGPGGGGGGAGGGGAGGGGGGAGAGGSGGGGGGAGAGGGGGDSHAELSGPNFSGTLEAFYSPRRNPFAAAAYIETYGRRAPTGGKFDALFAGGGIDMTQDGNPAASATAVATRRYPEAAAPGATLSPSYVRHAPTGGKFDAQVIAAPVTAPGPVMAENPPRAHFALQAPFGASE